MSREEMIEQLTMARAYTSANGDMRTTTGAIDAVLAALSSAPPDLEALVELVRVANRNKHAASVWDTVAQAIADRRLDDAIDALLAWSPAPPVAETPITDHITGYTPDGTPIMRVVNVNAAGNFDVGEYAMPQLKPASPVVAPAPETPDVVDGQCPRCGERDGAHAADCLHWTCDHCGHDREAHRDGAASRLERDGRFHPCGAGASPAPERCAYVHADGWTCGRAKGHPSVHVPPSRMANPTVPVVAPAPVVETAIRAGITFIENGVALGYIRMPDADCPDPAHRTLPLLRDALAALSPRETAPGGGR